MATKRFARLLLLVASSLPILPVARGQTSAAELAIQESNETRINLVTDKFYTGNEMVPYLLVIDGATNYQEKIPIGGIPGQIVVNPVTNKFYVDIYRTKKVEVMDGTTNRISKVTLPAPPYGVSVDPVRKKIYAADYTGGRVMVIDGATNQTSAITIGGYPLQWQRTLQ
ncbi:MAG TPA: hypothetical protein VJN21_05885 [Candidatus Acidoferrales bacterium]|nr:hypothetical protein [Candidatus Acidoferrales bacterium]